jgi:hypothetical protein
MTRSGEEGRASIIVIVIVIIIVPVLCEHFGRAVSAREGHVLFAVLDFDGVLVDALYRTISRCG